MGHIVDGKNILTQRPQPGRSAENTKVVKEKVVEKQPQVVKEKVIVEKESQIDISKIAEAVVEAIGDKISRTSIQTSSESNKSDGFDDSKTMAQLAQSMTVQRGDSESNFEDGLGHVAETQKDKDEVDQTIGILEGLNDNED